MFLKHLQPHKKHLHTSLFISNDYYRHAYWLFVILQGDMNGSAFLSAYFCCNMNWMKNCVGRKILSRGNWIVHLIYISEMDNSIDHTLVYCDKSTLRHCNKGEKCLIKTSQRYMFCSGLRLKDKKEL